MTADLNDLHAATNNLYQLLAVVHDLASKVYAPEMGERSRAVADRLSALAIIARDEAERIDTAVGDAIEAGKSSPSPVKSLFNLWIRQRDEASAKLNDPMLSEEASRKVFDLPNATQKVLLDTPATTLEDFAAKLIAAVDHGAYMDLGGFEGGDLIVREAAAIVGRTEHLEIEGCAP